MRIHKFDKEQTCYVDLDAVVAIGKGFWDNARQDWLAILHFGTGSSLYLGSTFVEEVVEVWKNEEVLGNKPL